MKTNIIFQTEIKGTEYELLIYEISIIHSHVFEIKYLDYSSDMCYSFPDYEFTDAFYKFYKEEIQEVADRKIEDVNDYCMKLLAIALRDNDCIETIKNTFFKFHNEEREQNDNSKEYH